jgi:hypothetical protein
MPTKRQATGWNSDRIARPRPNTHTCPRKGCTAQVSNRLFACRPDWFTLPLAVREEIHATAGRHVLDARRRAAFRAADEAWQIKDSGEVDT